MSGLYADIADELHSRVNSISLQNKEVVSRALKLYLSDQWSSEAEQEAQLTERRAEWHDSEATRLRERAAEHEQQAESLRTDAADLRADAESIPESVRDAGSNDTLGFEGHVDEIVEHLEENPGSVVWPEHGLVEDAVSATGVPAEAVLKAVEERGIESERVRDAPLNGGDTQ